MHFQREVPQREVAFVKHLVLEPTVGLIKWLRPKGLMVCSYVEMNAEFNIKLLQT